MSLCIGGPRYGQRIALRPYQREYQTILRRPLPSVIDPIDEPANASRSEVFTYLPVKLCGIDLLVPEEGGLTSAEEAMQLVAVAYEDLATRIRNLERFLGPERLRDYEKRAGTTVKRG